MREILAWLAWGYTLALVGMIAFTIVLEAGTLLGWWPSQWVGGGSWPGWPWSP